MNAKEYSKKYSGYPTYQKIAEDAFNVGVKCAKPAKIKKLENELKEAKAELNSLWATLHDPKKCGELLAGL